LSIGLSYLHLEWKRQTFSVYRIGRVVSKNAKLGAILGVKFETLNSNLGQLQFKQEAKLPLLSVSHQAI